MIFFINKTHLLNTPDLLITNKENKNKFLTLNEVICLKLTVLLHVWTW